jgi:hypothetical protein
MSASQKEAASQFVAALTIGDIDAAAAYLDPAVEYDGYHGTAEVRERLLWWWGVEDDEEIRPGKRKLKEIDGAVFVRVDREAYVPDYGYGPSWDDSRALRLTFRGDMIIGIEDIETFHTA